MSLLISVFNRRVSIIFGVEGTLEAYSRCITKTP